MKQAIFTVRYASQVAGSPPTCEKRKQGRNRKPNTGADRQPATWRVALADIDRARSDAEAEEIEEKLNGKGNRDAREDGTPGDATRPGGYKSALAKILRGY